MRFTASYGVLRSLTVSYRVLRCILRRLTESYGAFYGVLRSLTESYGVLGVCNNTALLVCFVYCVMRTR